MASDYYRYELSLNDKTFQVEVCEDIPRRRSVEAVWDGEKYVSDRNTLVIVVSFLKIFFRSGKEQHPVVRYKGGHNSGGVYWGSDDVRHWYPGFEH